MASVPRVKPEGMLGQLAKGIGELSRAVGINDGDGKTRRTQHVVSKPVQLARRLHDGKPGTGRPELKRQALAPLLAVGNAKTLANWMQINDLPPARTGVEPRITHAVPAYTAILAPADGILPRPRDLLPNHPFRP